jgi:hypothetical protein
VISVDISHVHASISMVQVAICLINAPWHCSVGVHKHFIESLSLSRNV